MFLVLYAYCGKGKKAFARIMTTLIYAFEVNTSGIAAVIQASS